MCPDACSEEVALVTAEKDFAYRIRGGRPVRGEIRCLGAKNFVTKAMIASLLAEDCTTLVNVPPIGDVAITTEMLESVGATVRPGSEPDSIIIDARGMTASNVPTPHSGSNRMPILLLGALLHRFPEVSVPALGGCKIGSRKVDFHIEALRAFGAQVDEGPSGITASRRGKLRGCQISLPYPSVGATETCLYLGVLAEGKSVISNAAIEPEIGELITMLRSMGAIIFTSSGREIMIEGVKQLHGTWMEVIGDRIEAASWACLACASNGDIKLAGIHPGILGNFCSFYQQIGGGIEIKGPDVIRFYRKSRLRPAIMETDVWPGLSTDWQQPFAILLMQADGVSVIHETVYENRFGYLKDLMKLGAKAQLATYCLGNLPCRYRHSNYEHSAIITGPIQLQATDALRVPDLRAGLGYVIAAAVAQGVSTISGISFVERGYGNIVPRLQNMNLDIERVEMALELNQV